ncbi:MAG: hypothetical protein IIZ39_03990, partial [Blautia sp.]|nr:hypothetical protein [Blautia sp.]
MEVVKRGRRLFALLLSAVLSLSCGIGCVFAGDLEENSAWVSEGEEFSSWDEENLLPGEEVLPERVPEDDFSSELVEAAGEEGLFLPSEEALPVEEQLQVALSAEDDFYGIEAALVGEEGAELTSYVNEKGEAMDPVSCSQVKAGDGNHVLGTGWHVVKGEVRFSAGMIITGEVNLILADGCSLYADDGIWVQPNASLSIWAQ